MFKGAKKEIKEWLGRPLGDHYPILYNYWKIKRIDRGEIAFLYHFT